MQCGDSSACNKMKRTLCISYRPECECDYFGCEHTGSCDTTNLYDQFEESWNILISRETVVPKQLSNVFFSRQMGISNGSKCR